jgi:hypothetical protein
MILLTFGGALVQTAATLALVQRARGLEVLGLLIGVAATLLSSAVAIYVYIERGVRRSVTLVGERFVVFPLLARLMRVCGEAFSISAVVASPLLFLSALLGGGAGASALVGLLNLPFRGNALIAVALLLITWLSAVVIFFVSYAVAEALDLWASMANDLRYLRSAQGNGTGVQHGAAADAAPRRG